LRATVSRKGLAFKVLQEPGSCPLGGGKKDERTFGSRKKKKEDARKTLGTKCKIVVEGGRIMEREESR